MCASEYGHVAVVELLLKYNALIDLKDVVSSYHEFDAVRTVFQRKSCKCTVGSPYDKPFPLYCNSSILLIWNVIVGLYLVRTHSADDCVATWLCGYGRGLVETQCTGRHARQGLCSFSTNEGHVRLTDAHKPTLLLLLYSEEWIYRSVEGSGVRPHVGGRYFTRAQCICGYANPCEPYSFILVLPLFLFKLMTFSLCLFGSRCRVVTQHWWRLQHMVMTLWSHCCWWTKHALICEAKYEAKSIPQTFS